MNWKFWNKKQKKQSTPMAIVVYSEDNVYIWKEPAKSKKEIHRYLKLFNSKHFCYEIYFTKNFSNLADGKIYFMDK